MARQTVRYILCIATAFGWGPFKYEEQTDYEELLSFPRGIAAPFLVCQNERGRKRGRTEKEHAGKAPKDAFKSELERSLSPVRYPL